MNVWPDVLTIDAVALAVPDLEVVTDQQPQQENAASSHEKNTTTRSSSFCNFR